MLLLIFSDIRDKKSERNDFTTFSGNCTQGVHINPFTEQQELGLQMSVARST